MTINPHMIEARRYTREVAAMCSKLGRAAPDLDVRRALFIRAVCARALHAHLAQGPVAVPLSPGAARRAAERAFPFGIPSAVSAALSL